MIMELISQYTQADAIDDGVLIDLMQGDMAAVVRAQIKFPVTVTATVWAMIEEGVASDEHCNDLLGVVHDLVWMARCAIKTATHGGRELLFKVVITGCKPRTSEFLCRGRKGDMHTLKLVCGPGDNMEPVMTIMSPDED